MKHTSRTILASLIVLAYSGVAHAAANRVDNLTFFTSTKSASAQETLRENAERFGLPANLDNLVLVRTQESLTGTHYYYQQTLRGLPVDRAEIVVSIGKRGELLKIFNETRHISSTVDAAAVNQLHNQRQISDEQALDKGWANLKVQHPLVALPTSELVWVATKGGVQLARKVTIEAQMPTGGFVQYLNAHDGSLIDSYTTSLPRKGGERSLAARGEVSGATLDRGAATQAFKAAQQNRATARAITANATVAASGIDGSGLVFDPDPRTALNNDSLTDSSPATAFDPAYVTKPLKDLTVAGGVYKLSGPYVNLKDIEAPATGHRWQRPGVRSRPAHRAQQRFPDRQLAGHRLRPGLRHQAAERLDRGRRRVQAERPVCEPERHRSAGHRPQHHHQRRVDGQARQQCLRRHQRLFPPGPEPALHPVARLHRHQVHHQPSARRRHRRPERRR
nr:hypothetical protein [Massilia sp. YIM B04103]